MHLEQKLLEEIDDLEEGENIYLEICDEESKHFTSLTTFHGMVSFIKVQPTISGTNISLKNLDFFNILGARCLHLFSILHDICESFN